MIDSIDFYPIGDDEPEEPTCAILDVWTTDERYSYNERQSVQHSYCLRRMAVWQTIKRLEKSLAIGSDQHRVLYVGQDEGYKYLVGNTDCRRLLNQLRGILRLM